jgi:hypothetical protein
LPLDGCDAQPTYGAYFEIIEAFVARDGYAPLREALAGTGCGLEAVREIVLKAEKHGALYHPASVTLGGADGEMVRLCVNVARRTWPGLPGRGGGLAWQHCGADSAERICRARMRPGRSPACGMLLEQWFAGFHEFHQDGRGPEVGCGTTMSASGCSIPVSRWPSTVRGARILTLHFDPETGASLGPWHHAAGDFVARVVGGAAVDVRCITVARYGAAHNFSQAGPMAGKLALLAFFTD